ncbi:hypothetical protein [Pseudostreptobacillus hongkongensis]|uniref:hypothetical protein n=1 Tax=Pseudostreptobacillus hongkongensis TaxID=1162717 RepID=UPI000833075F|nr:hypothetical protein [Pseudostreptobacillus hongkongensis]
MKKIVKLDDLKDIKQVKQLSSILLGLPEIDNIEYDLDLSTLIIFLNSNLADEIIKYYIKLTNLNILSISE